jgi:hypothetical protein
LDEATLPRSGFVQFSSKETGRFPALCLVRYSGERLRERDERRRQRTRRDAGRGNGVVTNVIVRPRSNPRGRGLKEGKVFSPKDYLKKRRPRLAAISVDTSLGKPVDVDSILFVAKLTP